MIFLIDQEGEHSEITKTIIEKFTTCKITTIGLPVDISQSFLLNTLANLSDIVFDDDIVCCPWVLGRQNYVDQILERIAKKTNLVCAAGNTSQDIINLSPAGLTHSITVGCLNKQGQKTKHTNFSQHKTMVWVVGTSYHMDDQTKNGTSISTAIYTGLLAEAIKQDQQTDIDLIVEKYNQSVINDYLRQ